MNPAELPADGATWLVVAAALAAGIAASYGRELGAKRRPDGQWWTFQAAAAPGAGSMKIVAWIAAALLAGLETQVRR